MFTQFFFFVNDSCSVSSVHQCKYLCCRVTPSDGETSPSGAPECSDRPIGATGGAGAMAMPATSTLSLPMSQGKPSLRRIKGRIHRSKSLDSIDLLDCNVSLTQHVEMNSLHVNVQHRFTLHKSWFKDQFMRMRMKPLL